MRAASRIKERRKTCRCCCSLFCERGSDGAGLSIGHFRPLFLWSLVSRGWLSEAMPHSSRACVRWCTRRYLLCFSPIYVCLLLSQGPQWRARLWRAGAGLPLRALCACSHSLRGFSSLPSCLHLSLVRLFRRFFAPSPGITPLRDWMKSTTGLVEDKLWRVVQGPHNHGRGAQHLMVFVCLCATHGGKSTDHVHELLSQHPPPHLCNLSVATHSLYRSAAHRILPSSFSSLLRSLPPSPQNSQHPH